MTFLLNTFAVIIFIFFYGFILKKDKKMVFLIPYFVPQLWAIISCFYIEHGKIFITEQARYAVETGATARLVIYNLILIIAVYLTLNIFKNTSAKLIHRRNLLIQNKSIDLTKFFINLSLIVVALFISLILIETVSVRIKFGEVNRFSFNSYMNLMKNPLFVIFDSGYPIVVTFLFIVIFEMKKFSYKLVSLMLILMLITKFLLQGHKFTPFYSSFLYLSIIYIILYFKNDKMKILTALKNKKVIIILTATVLLLSFRVVNNYKKEFNYTTDQAVEFSIYRALGLQGHVWWGVDYNEKVAPLNINERSFYVIKEFDSTENIKGLKRLMYYIAPKELVDHYLTYGVSFTMGFPAILIFLFGQYITIPILIFIGICLGIYISFLNFLLKTKRYFVFISQMYIYFTLITYFLLMGNAATFFTITNFLIFVTSIFVFLLANLLTKVKVNNHL